MAIERVHFWKPVVLGEGIDPLDSNQLTGLVTQAILSGNAVSIPLSTGPHRLIALLLPNDQKATLLADVRVNGATIWNVTEFPSPTGRKSISTPVIRIPEDDSDFILSGLPLDEGDNYGHTKIEQAVFDLDTSEIGQVVNATRN